LNGDFGEPFIFNDRDFFLAGICQNRYEPPIFILRTEDFDFSLSYRVLTNHC